MTGKKTDQARTEQSLQAKSSKQVNKQTKKTLKHWVAVTLFGAIIVVFALWGINPNRYGESNGGVAAVVNDTPISLAEYRGRVESIEQNMKTRFAEFPEAQRKVFSQQVRQRALEDLIMGEIMYQAAKSRGVLAPDTEVRDYILQIPFLQENGRFVKDRYRAFLQNMSLSTEEFERQVRKQIVGQKLQELFIGSVAPTREEVKRAEMLSHQKLNVRFIEISDEDLKKPGFISDDEVAAFVKSNKTEIESYYKGNSVEFTTQDKARARHILVRVDDSHKEAEALKLATDLRKQATPQNFAKLASEHSDDPGSKSKGGDLGEFERGRMVPEFEKAVFSLKEGQISDPIRTNFGFHVIYLEKKMNGGVQSLASVQNEIARKLILRGKQGEVLAKAKALIAKGNKKEVEAWLAKSGLKWQESGEFDLATTTVPKIGESSELLPAIVKHGKAPGLIPDLVRTRGGHLVVDLISWKESSAPAQPSPLRPEEGSLERTIASRKSSDLIEAWAKEVTAKADVQRNVRLSQQ